MSWGYKISLVIIVFIVGMLGMVYVASKQSNEMMDKDYYEKELEYQKLIDAAQNLNRLNIEKDSVLYLKNDNLLLQFPKGTYENGVNGTLELIRLDDEKKDKIIDLSPKEGLQYIPLKELHSGKYKIRLHWQHTNQPYYMENSIYIPQ